MSDKAHIPAKVKEADAVPLPATKALTQPSFFNRHRLVWSRAIMLFWENGGGTAAGNLAFLTMLSLFPFLLFLLSLSGFIGQTERGVEAVTFMLTIMPPEVASVLSGPVNGVIRNAGAEILTLSILFSLWVASAGIEAGREVVLKAYGKEHAPAYWLRRLQSLVLVIFAAFAIIIAMTAMVVTPAALKALVTMFPELDGGSQAEIIKSVSTILGPLILFLGLLSLYLSLTPRRLRKKRYLPGTVLSLLVLFGTARGYSIYLKYADTYDLTYGSLAGVMVTQIFCYLVSIGFILGAEVNAAYAEQANGGQEIEDEPEEDTATPLQSDQSKHAA